MILALLVFGFVGYRSLMAGGQRSLCAGIAKESAHQLGTPLSSLDRCPHCGALILAEDGVCSACGFTFCPRCLTPTGEEDRVCPGCDLQLFFNCPGCGFELLASTSICPSCDRCLPACAPIASARSTLPRSSVRAATTPCPPRKPRSPGRRSAKSAQPSSFRN